MLFRFSLNKRPPTRQELAATRRSMYRTLAILIFVFVVPLGGLVYNYFMQFAFLWVGMVAITTYLALACIKDISRFRERPQAQNDQLILRALALAPNLLSVGLTAAARQIESYCTAVQRTDRHLVGVECDLLAEALEDYETRWRQLVAHAEANTGAGSVTATDHGLAGDALEKPVFGLNDDGTVWL